MVQRIAEEAEKHNVDLTMWKLRLEKAQQTYGSIYSDADDENNQKM